MTESEKPISKEMFYSSYKNMADNISLLRDEFQKHADKMDFRFDKIEETGSKTLEQALKTNGRVNKHDWYFKLIWWFLGAFWTLILIFTPLIYRYITDKVQVIDSLSMKQGQIIN